MKKLFAFLIPVIFISSCFNKISSGVSDRHMFEYIHNSIGDAVEYEYRTDMNFYVKNDGTKVSFQADKSMEGTNGYLISYKLKIEGAKYQYSEVKGYFYKGVYYERVRLVRTNGSESTYGKRIVHGNRINIYCVEVGAKYPGHLGYNFYGQRGENGELEFLRSEDDIKKLVADCPLAVNIINNGSLGLQKTEGNSNYLNKAIKVYNNNCKPL